MKFGKQLKVQSVKEWQEYYVSYKRGKRIIKKLLVQRKEREEREAKAQRAQAIKEGRMTPELAARLARNVSTGSEGRSPALVSYSPTLSATPERDGAGRPLKPVRQHSGLAATSATGNVSDASPASNHSAAKGSPGLLMGGDAYQEFFALIETDIEKVNRFYLMKYDELHDRYRMLESSSLERSSSVTISGGMEQEWQQRLRSSSQPTYQTGKDEDEEEDEESPAETGPGGGFHSSVAAVSAWMAGQRRDSNEQVSLTVDAPRYGSTSDGGTGETHPSSDRSPLLSSTHPSHSRTSSKPVHIISESQSKKLENRLEQLLELYRRALQLQIYCMINYEGLRKILKKFDKNTGEDHSTEWLPRLEEQPFRKDTPKLTHLLGQIETLYTNLNSTRPNQDIYSSQGMLRGIKREVDNPSEEDPTAHQMNWLYVLLAIALAVAVLLLPILPHQPRAKSCAALLAMITVLWVTEAVPFFVAALAIPLMVVLLGILADPSGVPLTADKASKAAFGFMFNDTIMLIVGGFAISAAFSKCNFELWLASLIQRLFGDRPRVFLLAFMVLGAFLSCWISNIAAPVLLTSLLLPIVRDFGSTSPYARSLLLGLAIACNIGGMMSPISSPQNAIALGYLEQAIPKQAISFAGWIAISMPLCLLLVILSWLYLIFVFLRHGSDVDDIPIIVFEKVPVNRTQIAVMTVTIITIVLWCTLSYTEWIFGEMGTIAVLPVLVFFGTGILNKTDLLGFSWNLILLIGGGNVLGAAVNSSQLLHIISTSLEPYLAGHSAYATTVTVLLAVFLVTTFVSHTVAALILTPIIVDIAASTGSVQIVVMLATLMMSGAMSLPMSSFPNANSLLVDDDFNRPFLHPMDYIKHGSAISVLIFAALCTIGYMMAYVGLEHDTGSVAPIKGSSHHSW